MKKINIVGAGVSGLIAAKILEEHGFHPNIFEETSRIGGRIKTDVLNGFFLDRGFQVLLTSYPAVRRHLNLEKLNLINIQSGAYIFDKKRYKLLGDPSKNINFIFEPSLYRSVNLFDLLRIFKLKLKLKNKDLSDIFSSKETSTIKYLNNNGFSQKIIDSFFKPFFGGVFLESKLETSSRMFEFIFKMFSDGKVSIPKNGMEEIPKQIFQGLNKTTFNYNTKVKEVYKDIIELEKGKKIKSDYTIIATSPKKLFRNSFKQITWNSSETLYFETENKIFKKNIIGLISSSKSLINNFYYYPDTYLGKTNKFLLSVTILNSHNFDAEDLIQKVIHELDEYCDIKNVKFIKKYLIPHSIPQLNNLKERNNLDDIKQFGNVFLAGDQQLNGSLNAAIISGEQAAYGVIKSIQNKL
ncbi:MAG: oxidoreductase [Crocinitomicaceae bacterium]|nr:oxidoreductase [Crocinitomicaceae bacterium]|tara:strand:+ start:40527 stop:41759 length:1233 start_codon:yes stop_codon:yes gene_type:complete